MEQSSAESNSKEGATIVSGILYCDISYGDHVSFLLYQLRKIFLVKR